MSDNKQTVMKYVDGFSKTDHAQILSRLTDDIWWTVFGGHQVHGKHEYDARIEGGPEYVGDPDLKVVRMVEEDDVVMAELTGSIRRSDGGVTRWAMSEVFLMERGLIQERRAYVIELKENDYK